MVFRGVRGPPFHHLNWSFMKSKYALVEKRKRYLQLADEAERRGEWEQAARYLRRVVALGRQALGEEE